jgi:CRISPR-associated protein Csb2
MVAATAAVVAEGDAAKLSGERWQPTSVASADQRRVPTHGTLDELLDRHKAFLDRVRRDANGNEWFNPVPSLSTFRVVGYRLPTDPAWRLGASFNILKPDTSSRKAFDTASAALKVAGMVRCAAKLAAKDSGGTWTEEKINAFILGHGESNDGGGHVAVGPQRFAYLPLPTIESRGKGNARVVGSVRRVMLYCFAEGCEDEIIWAQRILSGQELVDKDKGQAVALLSVIPSNEKVVRCYAQAAATWATVTPVVLPGYDDPNHYRRRLKKGASSDEQKRLLESLDARIDGLLRKAIVQAGFCQELADHAQLDWRKVGFWPGTDLADRYGVPDHLKRFPRFHVKVGWRDARNQPVEIPGPVCFGGGRFYGLGLFAAYQ